MFRFCAVLGCLPGDGCGPVEQAGGWDEFAHYAERVGLGGGEDLTEQTGPGGGGLAPGVGEHADVDRGHRDADRHLVEPEGGVAGDGDAVVADRGRDEPAGEGVAVDGGGEREAFGVGEGGLDRGERGGWGGSGHRAPPGRAGTGRLGQFRPQRLNRNPP